MTFTGHFARATLCAVVILLSFGDANADETADFFADWGTGLAVVRNGKKVVASATIENGIVRVNTQSKYEASVLVARHFYPFRQQEERCADSEAKVTLRARTCIGAMVGVGLGSSSGGNAPLINMIGVGVTLGGRGKSEKTGWNFGLGVGRKFSVQTLGDGFSENAAPPAGETQVRYKTRDITTQFIFFTAHW